MTQIKNEIGSDFWDVPLSDKYCAVFPKLTQWYLSGRSALQAIIKRLKGIHTVALPSWCCDTMIRPFVDAGISVQFYPVYWDEDKRKIVQEIDTSCDALFLMEYFGYRNDITEKHSIIIRDMTHSIFSGSYNDADYYFGSLRKWCGVWTGGYAWTKDGSVLPMENSNDNGFTLLREKAMQQKNCYINGCLSQCGEQVKTKAYLELYGQAENMLEKCGIASAADRDVMAARHLDVEFIKKIRRENAGILMNAFPEILIFKELGANDCPLFVPIRLPGGKREIIRRELIDRRIYCPIHWPVSKYHCIDEKMNIIYDEELSLVCDQRYDENDMRKIVDVIKLLL